MRLCGKPLFANPKRYYLSRRDPFEDIESDSMQIGCHSCKYTFEVEEDYRFTLNRARQRVSPETYVVDKESFQRDPAEVLKLRPFARIHISEGDNIILQFDQKGP